MNIYDQHVHSNFSCDSTQDIEEYIQKAKKDKDEFFITTEHLDLQSHTNDGKDITPDINSLQNKLKQMSDKYNIVTLLGVEAGWREDVSNRVQEFINSYPFDMVLLSVHESDTYDVGNPEFYRNRSVDESYDEYLSLIYNCVSSFEDFDILAHIDYSIRYAGQTNLEKHKDKLVKIMNVLIEKGKTLEINTRTIDRFNTTYYIEYIIDLYLSLGGQKMSLASDCHRLSVHKNHFNIAIEILKQKNVKYLYFYKSRQEFTIPLP